LRKQQPGGDGVVLFGVAAVIGGVEREGAQRGELRLKPLQGCFA
jgi:hypothetical protein